MKNRIVKILLSSMIVSLSSPNIKVFGKEIDVNCGVFKELESILDNSIEKINRNSFRKVYTTANVNIRSTPSTEAEILDVIEFNKQIQIYDYDDEWAIIKFKNCNTNHGYINKKYITKNRCEYTEFNLPKNNGFKSYMPYMLISDKSSSQYNLQQNYAYTGNYGIRQVNSRYCVAIGTAFEASIGTYFDLILDNDVIIPCIVADIKADMDTLSDNITTANNGCVSEFVVDTSFLNSESRKTGDISFCQENWNSSIKMIRLYDKNIFE